MAVTNASSHMSRRHRLQHITSMYSFWGRARLYNPATWLTFLGRERRVRHDCVRHLRLRKGDRVLDVACGTGRNHPYLRDAVGSEGWIVGVDLTSAMLGRARAQAGDRGWDNVSLIQADAAAMELPAESFDGVICVLGFSVIPHYEEAIRRAVALLKRDGRIVICDAAPFKGVWRMVNLVVEPIYRGFACWDPRRDIQGTLQQHVTEMEVHWLHGGSLFVAVGKR